MNIKKILFGLSVILTSWSIDLNNQLNAMKKSGKESNLVNIKSPDYSTSSLNEKMKKMLEDVIDKIDEFSITKNISPPIIVEEKPIEEEEEREGECTPILINKPIEEEEEEVNVRQKPQLEKPVSTKRYYPEEEREGEEEDDDDFYDIENTVEKEPICSDTLIRKYRHWAKKCFNPITKEFKISTIYSTNNATDSINLLKVGIHLFGKDITRLYISKSYLSDSKCLENLITESNLPNLEILVLSHNYLRSIHNLKHSKLRVLHLQNNKLRSLPDFRFLPNLQDLRVDKNELSELPDFILPNLEYLWASENRIEEVVNFTYLKKLRKLWLFENRLKTVPNFDLPNLTHLWIFDNQITKLPDFDKLPSLCELKAKRNHFFNEKPTFNHLPKMCHIIYY